MTVTSFTVGVVGTYYDYFSSVGTLKHSPQSNGDSIRGEMSWVVNGSS